MPLHGKTGNPIGALPMRRPSKRETTSTPWPVAVSTKISSHVTPRRADGAPLHFREELDRAGVAAIQAVAQNSIQDRATAEQRCGGFCWFQILARRLEWWRQTVTEFGNANTEFGQIATRPC